MNTVTIHESGMVFGPFAEDSVFLIEKSPAYDAVRQGIKIVEFVLHHGKPSALWFVEAKTRPANPGGDRFLDFRREMVEKFGNSVSLFVAIRLGHHPPHEQNIPPVLRSAPLNAPSARLLLVVKHADDAWLPELQNAVAAALRGTVRVWGLEPNSVIVLNESRARKYGIVS